MVKHWLWLAEGKRERWESSHSFREQKWENNNN